MKKIHAYLLAGTFFTGFLLACVNKKNTLSDKDYPIQPVSASAVKINDIFWYPKLETNHRELIPLALLHCTEIIKKYDKISPGKNSFPGLARIFIKLSRQ